MRILIWNWRVIRPQPSTSAAAQRLEDTQQPSSLNAPAPAIYPPPAAATVDKCQNPSRPRLLHLLRLLP